jgi:hypothetical protein
MTASIPELLQDAEEWADGCASTGLKGNTREMALANLITQLGTTVEALVREQSARVDALGFVEQTIYANEDSDDSVVWRNSEVLSMLIEVAERLRPWSVGRR